MRSRVWTVLRFGVPFTLPPLFGKPFGLPGPRLAGGAPGAGVEVPPFCDAPGAPPERSGAATDSRALSGAMPATDGVPGAVPELLLVFSAVMSPSDWISTDTLSGEIQ